MCRLSIPSPADPLTLGQHLVSVFDTGTRVAAYELAKLVVLLELGVAPAGLVTKHKPTKT